MSLALNERRSRRHERDQVRPGEQFRRWVGSSQVETATVLDLRWDPIGIPHVRFNLAFERTAAVRIDAGPRTLALRSFVSTYRERVS